MKRTNAILTTDFESDLTEIPFADYPRPQMRRDSYLCLNGAWDFRVERRGKTRLCGTITVPFPPESRLSGIECEIGKHDVMIYTRPFVCPERTEGDRVLLHVGACDQTARVLVNDTLVGEHVGGYLPFDFDITEALCEGENTLRIEARDPM